MSARKWTKIAVILDARKYESKTEWSHAGSAYVIAHRNGWLNEACAHMQPKWEHKWDKAAVLASASKHEGRAQWKAAEPGAYKAAMRKGWLDEACTHMQAKHRDWTVPALQASAAPFATRGAWKEADGAAYKAALERGALDRICAHMTAIYKPDGWWTKERVFASARQYRSIALWNAAETSAYQMAKKRGWMKEATGHMDQIPFPIGPATIHEFLMSHRIPYEAEYKFRGDPEVGNKPFDFFLPQQRLLVEYHGRQHAEGWSRDSASREEIQRRDEIKSRWASEHHYRLVHILAWREKSQQKVRERLADVLGVSSTLPRSLTAAQEKRIRSGVAWTYEDVLADAKKYRTRTAWMKDSPNAYRFALRHELADQATRHMERLIEHGKWTKQTVLADARKYGTKGEWHRASPSAYVIARRNGWARDACEHMTVTKAPNGYWTAERLLAEGARFENTAAWNEGSPISYSIAKKLKLVPASMPRKKKPHGFWSKERIALTAKTFKTRAEFRKTEPSAYTVAAASGWLEDVCAHMPVLRMGRSSA